MVLKKSQVKAREFLKKPSIKKEVGANG